VAKNHTVPTPTAFISHNKQTNERLPHFERSAMAKAKKTVKWDKEHKLALLKGFEEEDWDPLETDGKTINATIQSVPELFEILKPFFSVSDGGDKKNNTQIYDHYKKFGCEYIVKRTRAGIRRDTTRDSTGEDAGALFDLVHSVFVSFCSFASLTQPLFSFSFAQMSTLNRVLFLVFGSVRPQRVAKKRMTVILPVFHLDPRTPTNRKR